MKTKSKDNVATLVSFTEDELQTINILALNRMLLVNQDHSISINASEEIKELGDLSKKVSKSLDTIKKRKSQ